jgi:multiple sugar transport system ATP-binding protein
MASIHFEHVSKRFHDIVAVRDLTLSVHDQEFLVLVGPSGCGKTTVLRCLAGLEEVNEGTIYIGERLVNHVPQRDRDIAMVFQSYALYPHMSVRENMAFSLRLRARTGWLRKLLTAIFNRAAYRRIKEREADIAQRVEYAAAMLGISELLNRKPRALSGGQQQRVALGRAIVRDPAVFLMDEPLSNLDAKLRVQTRAEISKLHQRLQTTFIYVTHDQTEAMTMGTRIAVMRDGVLQQLDTPQALYDTPANKFVAGFIGSPAMNFFDAHLVRESDGVCVQIQGAFNLPVPPAPARILEQYVGQSIIFGIRPEDIHDAAYVPRGVGEQARIKARVNVTERMGSEVYVYIEEGGKEFIGRFDPRTSATMGQRVEAVVDMEKMHIFDHVSGNALV